MEDSWDIMKYINMKKKEGEAARESRKEEDREIMVDVVKRIDEDSTRLQDDDKRIEEDARKLQANINHQRKDDGKLVVSRPSHSLGNLKNMIQKFPLGSFANLSTLMWIYTTFFHFKGSFTNILQLYNTVKTYMFPQMKIVIHHWDNSWKRNRLYERIEKYLRDSASLKATNLRATGDREVEKIVLTIEEGENITDHFNGVELTWGYHCIKSTNTYYPDRYYYTLSFLRKYRYLVDKYLHHIVETSRLMNQTRHLYTNSVKEGNDWTSVEINHPANFNTLAMDSSKKEAIMEDLIKFLKSKHAYKKRGKAWKRGYLLYGPPGTGKSTMIAAMAIFMKYDIYDLELTAVKDNVSLRTLLTNTTNKSILVIEDIDCSLDLSGKRKTEDKKEVDDDDQVKNVGDKSETASASKVTLSGLLNFIDGLWSTSGEGRLIVFTTNHVEKLDPALTRRGRMDMHIEMSYCTYEAFKVLAKNYLEIDSHPLFDAVHELLNTTEITPADVAESLTSDPSSSASQVTERLEELISVLQKIQAKKKDEERVHDNDASNSDFV